MLDVAVWNPRVGLDTAGGTETFLRNVARRLDSREDTTVTVYTHDGGELPDIETVHVPCLRKEDRLTQALTTATPALPAEIESLSSVGRHVVDEYIDTERHDVLSTHYYLDALLLSRAVDLPTVFRLPGIKQPSPRWRALFGLSDVDRFVSNSPTTSERVREWYGRSLAGPVYAGVDTDRFVPAPGATIPKRVLYVGRLGEGKGLDRLLTAAEQLPDGYTIRIVGDGPLRERLEREASDAVEVVGQVPHASVQCEFQQAAVTVLPTVHEAFPVAVLESLACGTPVVATDIDATRLTVVDGATGRLLGDRAPATVADAMQEVGEGSHYQQSAETMGPQTASAYDWGEQTENYRGELAEVVA